jgi:hypothetical protein
VDGCILQAGLDSAANRSPDGPAGATVEDRSIDAGNATSADSGTDVVGRGTDGAPTGMDAGDASADAKSWEASFVDARADASPDVGVDSGLDAASDTGPDATADTGSQDATDHDTSAEASVDTDAHAPPPDAAPPPTCPQAVPAGATTCCGSMACVGRGGNSCNCGDCDQRLCPAVCCFNSQGNLSCVATPADCR